MAMADETRELYVGGLDLGQLQDHTALVLAKRTEGGPGCPKLDVLSLHRFELFTPYTTIVQKVRGWMARPPWDAAPLAVDQTGVGGAVIEMFEGAGLPGGIEPITITAGRAVTRQPGGGWHVAKVELVSVLQTFLSRRALGIPAALPESAVLVRELKEFKAKVTNAGTETFEADWRSRSHDDLCLGLGLCAFLSEHLTADLNVVSFDLSPTAPPRTPHVFYEQVRFFHQSGKYQPQPVIRGQQLLGAPDFRRQEEAALFVRRAHELLGSTPPDDEVPDLGAEAAAAVEAAVVKFLKAKQLLGGTS
jgi:hypothetical protein